MAAAVLIYVFLLGIAFAVYGGFGVLVQPVRHNAHRFLAALLFTAALGLVPPIMLMSAGPEVYRSVLVLLVLSQYAAGPLLLTYFTKLISPQSRRRDPIILASLIAPLVACSLAVRADAFLEVLRLAAGGIPVQMLFCIAAALLRLRAVDRRSDAQELVRPATGFLMLLGLAFISVAVGMFLDWPLPALAGNVSVVILLFVYSILVRRYPALLGLRLHVRRSGTEHAQDFGERLEACMRTERPYLDEDLSRRRLADLLNVNERELSAYLNDRLGLNFATFVNRYRVEEAQRLLIEEPERSILSITYAVGFNSRSSFYEAFQRELGRSPSDWRRGG